MLVRVVMRSEVGRQVACVWVVVGSSLNPLSKLPDNGVRGRAQGYALSYGLGLASG